MYLTLFTRVLTSCSLIDEITNWVIILLWLLSMIIIEIIDGGPWERKEETKMIKGRWFVTGDCHGEFARLWRFIKKFNLGVGDNIIVCGDMGLYWNKDKRDAEFWAKQYEENCNGVHLWWIDGNHENFDIIKTFGNKSYECSPHITYLPRGTVLKTPIGNMLFVGGADSVDKIFRTEHLSWWKEERITEEDIEGITGHYKYVFSHCCPYDVFVNNKAHLCTLSNINEKVAIHDSEKMLEKLRNNITYGYWFFGHYHVDAHMWPTGDRVSQERCVYTDFVEIGGDYVE